jgi:hypothetical protein
MASTIPEYDLPRFDACQLGIITGLMQIMAVERRRGAEERVE